MASEIIVKTIADNVRDGEVVGIGVNSPLSLAASWLAKESHAPNVTTIVMGSFVNPEPGRIPAEYIDYVNDFFPLVTSGGLDYITYGALQVDKRGNINMHRIGSKARPKLVGPGVPAITLAAFVDHFDIILERHDKRTLVDQVDFISIPGHSKPGLDTDSMGRGPRLIITPIAVFGFEHQTRKIKLKTIHSGHSRDEVVINTGFPFTVDRGIRSTASPSPKEAERIGELIKNAKDFMASCIWKIRR